MCALQVSRQILLILFRNRHSYQCNRGMLKTIEQDANCMLVTWLGNFSCNSCSHCIIVNIVLAIWCFEMSKGREIEREREMISGDRDVKRVFFNTQVVLLITKPIGTVLFCSSSIWHLVHPDLPRSYFTCLHLHFFKWLC